MRVYPSIPRILPSNYSKLVNLFNKTKYNFFVLISYDFIA